MKKFKLRLSIALCCLLIAEAMKRVPVLSGFYAEKVYPSIMAGLNRFSSLFPFSLYDLFITALIVWLVAAIIRLIRKRDFRDFLCRFSLILIWLYTGFYLLWGINYFAPDFYRRNDISRSEYDEVRFKQFVTEYVDSLNTTFRSPELRPDSLIDSSIRTGYDRLSKDYALTGLPQPYRPKTMIFPSLYGGMGIKGYYGPFFAETHVNELVEPWQIAFTRAHETAHLLGITNEAEANLYAYLVLTNAADPHLRFEGYFEILPYVLSNARMNLPEAEYKELTEKIDPRVRDLYTATQQYWQEMYNATLGDIQGWFYNLFLRGNNIPQGTLNYSQVVGLIIDAQDAKGENRF